MKTIPILMYHQIDVAAPKGSAMRGLVVAPRTFFWHMAVLWALGYRGLSMGELEPYLQGQRHGRVFGITFDDGYANNLAHALPVLRRFGFTATCYVVADMVGQYNRWDTDLGIAASRLMNTAQLQQWVDGGQEVGSHTLTHAHLPALKPEQQLHEIAASKARLEAMLRLPQAVRHFCYPYGEYTVATLQAVQAAGYASATTTVRGRAQVSQSVGMWDLPRVLVSRTTTVLHLLLKCFTRYEDRRNHAAATTPPGDAP
jgi:peptidoglycan/xylan/chitin deacetylase (PgdA/CDA1 family)